MQRLVYRKQAKGNELKLAAFSDATWGTDMDDRISQSGGLFYFGGCLVDWYGRKQKALGLSSVESEFYALNKAGLTILFLKMLMEFLNLPPRSFTW